MNARIRFVISCVGLTLFAFLLVRHGGVLPRSENNAFESRSLLQETIIRGDGFEFSRVPRKVVILPGPHKTGSSSVQRNMVLWTRSRALKGWTWPQAKTFKKHKKSGKNFLKLVMELWYGRGGVKQEFAESFRESWAEGKNIVFGSELMDLIARDTDDRIIDGLLDMMPWNQDPTLYGDNSLITVSVTYRSPRAEHLISVWHQVGKEGVPLSEFILNLEDYSRQWHCSLNPLGVAEKFAGKGLSTVIVDTSGLNRERLDVSMVIACEVLDAFCRDDKMIGIASAPEVKNVKFGRGEMDLSELTLKQIDEELMRMDAYYCHLARASNVRVLHGLDVFSWCDQGNFEQGAIDSFEAVRRIKRIVAEASQAH